MSKEYKVTGKFKEKNIDVIVMATSLKQAKVKAGFMSGNGGHSMTDFMKSKEIKVEEN